jgi:hypothetical protein
LGGDFFQSENPPTVWAATFFNLKTSKTFG